MSDDDKMPELGYRDPTGAPGEFIEYLGRHCDPGVVGKMCALPPGHRGEHDMKPVGEVIHNEDDLR